MRKLRKISRFLICKSGYTLVLFPEMERGGANVRVLVEFEVALKCLHEDIGVLCWL